MEIPNAETDDGMTAGMSYVLREEGQLAQVWGEGDRAVAHATSGPCLQQNLVCVLEGEG